MRKRSDIPTPDKYKWIPKGILRMYHGTFKENLDRILSEGLKPFPTKAEVLRENLVWLSNDFDFAKDHILKKARKLGKNNVVILVLDIDTSKVGLHKSIIPKVFTTHEVIPPNMIVDIINLEGLKMAEVLNLEEEFDDIMLDAYEYAERLAGEGKVFDEIFDLVSRKFPEISDESVLKIVSDVLNLKYRLYKKKLRIGNFRSKKSSAKGRNLMKKAQEEAFDLDKVDELLEEASSYVSNLQNIRKSVSDEIINLISSLGEVTRALTRVKDERGQITLAEADWVSMMVLKASEDIDDSVKELDKFKSDLDSQLIAILDYIEEAKKELVY